MDFRAGPETGDPPGALARPFAKASCLPGLFATTTISIWLIVSHTSGWYGESALGYIQENRGDVATIVQIISYILGALDVYALNHIFNMAGRLRRDSSLKTLGFFHALSTNNFDTSIGLRYILLLSLFLGVALVPSALWAGAITPVIVSHSIAQSIPIAVINNATGFNVSLPAQSKLTNDGFFSFDPSNPPLSSSLLSSAGLASYEVNGETNYDKPDRTGYKYIGRSYGMGSAVGLEDHVMSDLTTAYTYHETGSLPKTNCIYNESLILNWDLSANWNTKVLEVLAHLPNSDPHYYNEFAALGTDEQEILAVPVSWQNGRYMAAFSLYEPTGSPCEFLHEAQCETTFEPWDFQVQVNRKAQTITVTPNHALDEFTSHSDALFNRTFLSWYNMQLFSAASTPSILCTTFKNNLVNVQHNLDSMSNDTSLRSMELTMNSLVDSIIGASMAAQLVIANDTTAVPLEAYRPVIVFGTALYIYAVFGLNIAIVLLYFAEALRTRCWRGLPRLDYTDLKAVIVASSAGGPAIARANQQRHSYARGTTWQGEAHDQLTSGLRVRLRLRNNIDGAGILGPSLTLLDDGADNGVGIAMHNGMKKNTHGPVSPEINLEPRQRGFNFSSPFSRVRAPRQTSTTGDPDEEMSPILDRNPSNPSWPNMTRSNTAYKGIDSPLPALPPGAIQAQHSLPGGNERATVYRDGRRYESASAEEHDLDDLGTRGGFRDDHFHSVNDSSGNLSLDIDLGSQDLGLNTHSFLLDRDDSTLGGGLRMV